MRCSVASVVARALLVAMLPLRAGLAQQAVANGDVNVRSGQSTSSRILGRLAAGDTVNLLSTHKRRGYYRVRASADLTGWAYARYLDVIAGAEAPTSTPTPSPNSGPATITAVATAVDPTWEKPAPNSAVFHRSGFPNCGPTGQGGDSATNRRKNRTDEPAAYHPVTFAAILALPYPKNHKRDRSTWTRPQLDTIARFEGVAVSVTGFIAKQRGIIVEDAQNSQNGESTNCHATDDPGVDWHVTLVQDPNDSKSAGIVVETTPRVRANGHPWTPAMLANAVTDRDSVRISGWLMYDPEHFDQTTSYDPANPPHGTTVRATLWEVHPIMKIEVFDPASGSWRSIP